MESGNANTNAMQGNGGEGSELQLTPLLPNDVVYHVLSFLPAKEIVRTSVLSRSWSHAWTLVYVSDFCFQQQHYRSEDRTLHEFLHFAENTLRRQLQVVTRTSSRRLRLSLAMTRFHDLGDKLKSLINLAAGYPKVQELHLEIGALGLDRFGIFQTTHLYSAISLTSLRLHKCDLRLRDHVVDWPSLRELHLTGCPLDESVFLKLSSACPVLKTITIIRCQGRLGGAVISLSRFEKLVRVKVEGVFWGAQLSISDTPSLRFLYIRKFLFFERNNYE